MINQATADNIRNLNTHITRRPVALFDPAERRAALAANVDGLCRKHGMTDPSDINAWVRLSMCYLENGRSAATALEQTRRSIERVAKQLVEIQIAPKSVDNLADHYRNLRFIREAAQQRFIHSQQRRQTIKKWLKRGGVMAVAMIGLAAFSLQTSHAEQGAKPGDILAGSELSKAQRSKLNIMPTVSESRRHHGTK